MNLSNGLPFGIASCFCSGRTTPSGRDTRLDRLHGCRPRVSIPAGKLADHVARATDREHELASVGFGIYHFQPAGKAQKHPTTANIALMEQPFAGAMVGVQAMPHEGCPGAGGDEGAEAACSTESARFNRVFVFSRRSAHMDDLAAISPECISSAAITHTPLHFQHWSTWFSSPAGMPRSGCARTLLCLAVPTVPQQPGARWGARWGAAWEHGRALNGPEPP